MKLTLVLHVREQDDDEHGEQGHAGVFKFGHFSSSGISTVSPSLLAQ